MGIQVAAQVDMENVKVRVFSNGSLVHEEIFQVYRTTQEKTSFIGMGELSYAMNELRFSSTISSG